MSRIGGAFRSFSIPELTVDPSNPAEGDAWVLKSSSDSSGTPIGLLLTLTRASSTVAYQLSYKTISVGIKRATLT